MSEAQDDARIERLAELEAAARALVERLDFVHAHDAYRRIWGMAHAHGVRYDGPQYVEELEALRSALAAGPSWLRARPDLFGGGAE